MSDHCKSDASEMIKAIPDVEIPGTPSEVIRVQPPAQATCDTTGTVEDETYIFTFSWSGKNFQLELRGTDRYVRIRKSSVQLTDPPGLS